MFGFVFLILCCLCVGCLLWANGFAIANCLFVRWVWVVAIAVWTCFGNVPCGSSVCLLCCVCFVFVFVISLCFGCLVCAHGFNMFDGWLVLGDGLLLHMPCPLLGPSVQSLLVQVCRVCAYVVVCVCP